MYQKYCQDMYLQNLDQQVNDALRKQHIIVSIKFSLSTTNGVYEFPKISVDEFDEDQLYDIQDMNGVYKYSLSHQNIYKKEIQNRPKVNVFKFDNEVEQYVPEDKTIKRKYNADTQKFQFPKPKMFIPLMTPKFDVEFQTKKLDLPTQRTFCTNQYQPYRAPFSIKIKNNQQAIRQNSQQIISTEINPIYLTKKASNKKNRNFERFINTKK